MSLKIRHEDKRLLMVMGFILIIIGIGLSLYPGGEMQYIHPYSYQNLGIILAVAGIALILLGILVPEKEEAHKT